MSPRNKSFGWMIFCLVFAMATTTGFAQESVRQAIPANDKNIFVRFYQDHISGVDGNRCPMSPSCSEYAARAIKKHGLAVGWVMACDRLLRCGRDETHLSPVRRINGDLYIWDPVKANDFWWFKKTARGVHTLK